MSSPPPLSPHLKRERGSVYLVGDEIDFAGNLVASEAISKRLNEQSIGYAFPPKYVSKRDKRDGKHRHMTLISKRDIGHLARNYRFGDESSAAFRALLESDETLEIQTNENDAKPTNKILESIQLVSERVLGFCQSFLHDRMTRGKDWFVLGIGRQSEKSIERGNNETFFLVCSYPRAAALRRKLGLKPKDFHITLGFDQRDIHDCSKGVDSLLLNRSQSLEVTMSQIISTPTELVEAARITILGGHPNDKMKGTTKFDGTINIQKGRFHDANILLDAAEGMIEKIQGGPINFQNTLQLLSLLGDYHLELTLFLEILEMRCQILGRKQDFGNVVKYADTWIDILETMQSSEESTSTDLTSIALGYKGVALAMRKEWPKALTCLRTSYELYHVAKRRNGKHRDGIQTRLESQREREAVSIERMLVKCCSVTGSDAPMPPLIAFPRTAHLFNTGGTAVSSDDCVLSEKSSMFRDFGNGVNVIVEEKIDGANLGFALSATGEILAQNRSHFVTKADHHQFGVLPSWIHEHRKSLVKILSSPNDFKQRAASQGLILYGEWCVARHSIKYDKLPGYFIAFDLYDRLEQKFYSRKRFHQVLHKSCIPYAPVIATKRFGPYPHSALRNMKTNPFESDLRELLDTKSTFATDGGLAEGVVLRIDDEDSTWLVNRVKIVRPDFVNGIQGHWARQEMQKQTVDWEFAQEYCRSNDEYCENYSLSPPDVERVEGDETVCLRERIDPRQRMTVSNGTKDDVILPRNFSFLWKGEVALSSTPKSVDQIQAWNDHFRTSLVVTLTEEEPLPQSWFRQVDACRNLFVPVPNYHAPSKDQMDEIVQAIEETVQGGGSAVVHCGGGKGRAGTVGACLLMQYGSLGIRASASAPSTIENLPTHFNSAAAIAFLRTTRPGSIETEIQEKFVRQYSDLLWKRVILPDFGFLQDKPCNPSVTKSEENSSKLLLPAPNDKNPKTTNRPTTADKKQTSIERKLVQKAQRRAPRCIICMGLPGSGKSTFANRLAESFPPENSWLVINQDKLGRKECERLAGTVKKGRSNNRIILDRCNPTASERARWLELMHAPPKGELALVYFSADAETCIHRVQGRTNHETIPHGRGKRIVTEMQAKLEPPTPLERKRYGSVHVVHTFHDAEEVLRSLGARA